jgi:hypothetical protein
MLEESLVLTVEQVVARLKEKAKPERLDGMR